MNSTLTINIIRFVTLIILQILICNQLNFLGSLNPFVYVLFIILYPIGSNRMNFIFISFLIGLIIDLFLDTHPYGAHTTASEVIRMGVPIITIMGNSFASRVATSILKNVGLEKLVTKNIEEYTNTAIDFGLNKNKILDIKNYLSDPSNTEILYNSKKFTKDLENIFQNLIKI